MSKPFGSFPPLKVKHWNVVAGCFSLEQKGLLIDALDWAWTQRGNPDDLEAFRKSRRVDKRKFERLWSEDLAKAFIELRSIRRPFDEIERAEVFENCNGSCSYCGTDLQGKPFHIDHVTPVSKGGVSNRSNLTLACPSCNMRKGARYV